MEKEDNENKKTLSLKSQILKYKQEASRLKKVNRFSYTILKYVDKMPNFTDFCKIIHQELTKIMACKNFYIALYNEEENNYHFPYHIDKCDRVDDDSKKELPGSLTDYIRRTGKAKLIDSLVEKTLFSSGELKEMVGEPTAIWMRAPLFSQEGSVIGVVALQDYENEDAYDKEALSLLKHVSRFIGFQINNFRIKQKLKEEQIKVHESDLLKTAFLANFSHEIKTPLNAIIGYNKLLMKTQVSSKNKEFVSIIDESSQRLLKMVSDILDFSTMEFDNIVLQIEEVSLKPFFESLFIHYGNLLPSDKKNKISISLSNNIPDIKPFLDSEKINQILDNLITNAIKFTERGIIKFGYTVVNDFIEFEVKDTGPGIVEEYKDEIFEKFYRIQDNRLLKNGQGLGLAICKSLVSKMGGVIWVEKNISYGSIFRFKLPYCPVESVKKTSDINNKIKEGEKNFDFTGKKILFVDDEDVNLYLLETFLKSTNAEFLFAKNPQEAINFVLSDQKIDLILMDCKMEGDNKAGIYATKKILQYKPNLPIIMQTAFLNGIEKESLNAGCVDYISKPIDRQKLLMKMSKYL